MVAKLSVHVITKICPSCLFLTVSCRDGRLTCGPQWKVIAIACNKIGVCHNCMSTRGSSEQATGRHVGITGTDVWTPYNWHINLHFIQERKHEVFCAKKITNRSFILVFNQLDTQNLFYSKFYFTPLHVSSTCAHHQEVKIALYSFWYHHTYRWPSRAREQKFWSEGIPDRPESSQSNTGILCQKRLRMSSPTLSAVNYCLITLPPFS